MDDKIKDRIRRLLALTEPGSGATENERELAEQQATKLLQRYNIEHLDEVEFVHHTLIDRHHTLAYSWLAHAAARRVGIKFHTLPSRPRTLVFFGPPDSISLALVFFERWSRQMELESAPYGRARTQFKKGYAAAVNNRVHALVKQERASEPGSALVLVDRIEDAYRKANPHLRTRSHSLKASSATYKGSLSGQQADLSRGSVRHTQKAIGR